MAYRVSILPLLGVLSMLACIVPARAEDKPIERCVIVRPGQNIPQDIGYTLKRLKLRDIDMGDGPVTVQPMFLGMKGPRVTFLGRDVRLAVQNYQTSPQELWHKAQWNDQTVDPCKIAPANSFKKIKSNFYWHARLDHTMGLTNTDPSILYRTRGIADMRFTRPYGFVFGASVSVPLSTNTEVLLFSNDTRDPVRRDMARFANSVGLERLYASWRATPFTDMHVAFTGGWLEEMYGGFGGELVYRPFGSPLWAGADAWKLWRRDPDHIFNSAWTDEDHFTGHVRIGYDVPDTMYGFSLAAGQYLAGDTGATMAFTQDFENGARLEASVSWTNRREEEGLISDTHFDPMLRITWPIYGSRKKDVRVTMRQVGRDGGQQLDRPLPLEDLTQGFSMRDYARHWPDMFE